MIAKILVVMFAFVANFMIQWYGNFTGSMSSKGTYLGMHYDSLLVRSIVTQFEYLWVLIIINVLFTMMFGIWLSTFKNYLSLASIWLAMGPISAFVFNSLILKQQASIVAIIGMVFIVIGSVFVIAQKEILVLFVK